MLRKRSILTCLFAFSLLAFAGCTKQTAQLIPSGPQVVVGVVKPAEISITRRGTHLLFDHDTPVYYLESTTVNLRMFEGREVEVHGTVEANTTPSDLPVLVVSSIVGGQSTATRSWMVPAMGISLSTPPEWVGKIITDSAVFTSSGSTRPILTVFFEGDSHLLSLGASSSVPQGIDISTLSLSFRSVMRARNLQTGSERTQIDLRPYSTDPTRDVLTLLFTPTDEAQVDPEAWETLKMDIIHSVTFSTDSSSSNSSVASNSSVPAPPLSGSGAGMPCGGVAGILCPKGYFCEITDTTANSGNCQQP
jgi:hypothetical protein